MTMSSQASPALIPCKDSGVRALVLCALSLSQTHTHTHTHELSQHRDGGKDTSFLYIMNENLIQCIYRKSSSVHTELESINLAK